MSEPPEPASPDASPDVPPDLGSLPAELQGCVVEHCDARTLARLRVASSDLQSAVDSKAADLLAQRLREGREVARCGCLCAPRASSRSSPAGFVAHITPAHHVRLCGGMECGGSIQPLHAHALLGGWSCASFGARHTLLVRRADGAVVAHGRDFAGGDTELPLRCEACVHCGRAPTDDDADAEDEPWSEPSAAAVGARRQLGLAPECEVATGVLLPIPERAVSAVACPRSSHVVGESGALYTSSWHGMSGLGAGSLPSFSRWCPPTGAQRIVEVSALYYHALMRSACGAAYAFGDAHEGKLGFDPAHHGAPSYVPSPRLVSGLAPHVVAGVAAGGGHSLFLTERGECFGAGGNEAGQLGDGEGGGCDLPPPLRHVLLPEGAAPLVQLAAGDAHSLALTHTGAVYAFGLNDRGQLGIAAGHAAPLDARHVASPTLVAALAHATHVTSVAASPGLSVFQGCPWTDSHTSRVSPADGGDGPREPAAGDGASVGASSAPDGERGERGVEYFVAGDVTRFNVPGTVATSGLRFLPSCYGAGGGGGGSEAD